MNFLFNLNKQFFYRAVQNTDRWGWFLHQRPHVRSVRQTDKSKYCDWPAAELHAQSCVWLGWRYSQGLLRIWMPAPVENYNDWRIDDQLQFHKTYIKKKNNKKMATSRLWLKIQYKFLQFLIISISLMCKPTLIPFSTPSVGLERREKNVENPPNIVDSRQMNCYNNKQINFVT